MIQEEIWKDIPEYEGLYQVSNLGRVKSLPRTIVRSDGRKQLVKERILKGRLGTTGYFTVGLYKDKKQKTHKVHKLVAIAFLGHEPNGFNGLIVDHLDNNRLNNKLENLQLITTRENNSKDKKGGSSKYTGVCWHKNEKKWYASIKIGGKSKHLGAFTCELEASEAYQKALKSL